MEPTRLLTSEEAAAMLGKPSGPALRAAWRRDPAAVPPAIRQGTRLYWNRNTILEWIKDQEEETKARALRDAEFRRRVKEAGLA